MTGWRFEVELRSPQVLADAMAYRGDMKVRDLAGQSTAMLKKSAPRLQVSRSEIGHLRSGYRKRVKPEKAAAIAKVLGVPVGLLFVELVSNGSQDIRSDRQRVA